LDNDRTPYWTVEIVDAGREVQGAFRISINPISVEHDTYFGAKGIFHSSLRTYAAGWATRALGQTEQSKPKYSPEGDPR
jgi:hypothetical protein